jgi:hypothetical protein
MKIEEILENEIILSFNYIGEYNELINHYILFNDKKKIVGEIVNIKKDKLIVRLIGTITDDNFSFGVTSKPSYNAEIELISPEATNLITSYSDDRDSLYIGHSAIFSDLKINMNVTKFFNSHFSIIGGTGSGKSFSLSRIVQTLFENKEKAPYNASIFVFDTFGEYHPSFINLEKNNPNISFKNYTTNPYETEELLKIPPFLLGVDDLAILLNAEEPGQLQVIEKALELVNIFKQDGGNIESIKNDIIARAILDILLSGRPSVQIRDQILSILSFYKTPELNLESILSQPGYNRSLKNCLIIDTDGKLREIELLTKFFNSFVLDNEKLVVPKKMLSYSLEDLENAIDFALISEGILKSEKIYDRNNLLKVRIHNLIDSEYKNFFDYPEYIDKESYIASLIIKNNKKAQLINFNINYVDDRLAKTIVKILSKMLFDVSKTLKPRASIPFHIILEEAHRYVQNDGDVDLLGYNIFERIAKEGRKYGVLLGLITQRPSELSETVISQCNNFLIFKMTHPHDMDYINRMIPFMSNEISRQIQSIPPGYCYTFGTAFKLPMIVKFDMPDPTPISNNVNIPKVWY